MAKRCEICNKGPVVGRTVSHAHNVGPRRFEPNLQTVRALVNGATKRIRVCTRCFARRQSRQGRLIRPCVSS
jgi:large subunit ribosomal protein L28